MCVLTGVSKCCSVESGNGWAMKLNGRLSNADISRRVKQACSRYTFRELNEATGFHRETVRRYLAGKVMVPAAFVAAVCKLTGATELWLLHGIAGEQELPGGGFESERASPYVLDLAPGLDPQSAYSGPIVPEAESSGCPIQSSEAGRGESSPPGGSAGPTWSSARPRLPRRANAMG